MPTLEELAAQRPATVNPTLLQQIASYRSANPRPDVTDVAGYGPNWGSYLANLARNFAGQFEGLGTPQNLMGPFGFGGITAFHGSPHNFSKFDMSKVGTGEGAQAYGHGLYFAENPSIADTYRRALSDHAIEVGGQRLNPAKGSIEDRAMAWVQGAVDAQPANPFQYAKQQARSILGKNSSVADEIAKQIDEWQLQGAQVTGGGYKYKVDIPDDQVAKMLDWDKPLSEQTGHIKAALLPVVKDTLIKRGTQKHLAEFHALRTTGEDIYKNVLVPNRGNAKTTEMLRSLGVPGIRYFDQGSRSGGKGTSNFVVFDDQIPKIIGKE